MKKSLTSKFHLNPCLYSHHMIAGASLEDRATVFKEIIMYDLKTMEVKYDEDLELILLCLPPSSYANFRDTILYSHDTLNLDEVYDALFSKEKMNHLVGGSEA